jgi:hypothetical protein
METIYHKEQLHIWGLFSSSSPLNSLMSSGRNSEDTLYFQPLLKVLIMHVVNMVTIGRNEKKRRQRGGRK